MAKTSVFFIIFKLKKKNPTAAVYFHQKYSITLSSAFELCIFSSSFLLFGSRTLSLHSRFRTSDGLARAKASGAADADIALGIRGGGVRYRLYVRIVPDDGLNLRWRCGSDHIGDGPQLAFLQSPPAQVVGPQRG